MPIKLYMKPRVVDFGEEESGMRRVVEAYEQYLPPLGYAFVDDPVSADLTIGHAFSMENPDVFISHGFYWTADYEEPAPKWEHKVNGALARVARNARQIITTSTWVQEVFQRDMHLSPAIVPHGVDWDLWQEATPPSAIEYVLWNKN